ncbi:hypothetical protein U3C44_23010 (plasmid) [Enterobacter asburiae]|nr:hypothetical protein [Enterobacter asburiae]
MEQTASNDPERLRRCARHDEHAMRIPQDSGQVSVVLCAVFSCPYPFDNRVASPPGSGDCEPAENKQRPPVKRVVRTGIPLFLTPEAGEGSDKLSGMRIASRVGELVIQIP